MIRIQIWVGDLAFSKTPSQVHAERGTRAWGGTDEGGVTLTGDGFYILIPEFSWHAIMEELATGGPSHRVTQ